MNEVVSVWNATPFHQVKCLTAERMKYLRVRLLDKFWSANWRQAVAMLCRSDFCLGKNDRGWKADFDFFLRPGTVAKVLEGKYGNGPRVVKNPITGYNYVKRDLGAEDFRCAV